MQVQFESDLECTRSNRLKLNWDFGDGTKGNGWRPMHLYEKGGSYVARLEVWGSHGLEGRGETRIFVHTK